MLHPKRSLVIKVASAVSALAMIAGVAGIAITRTTHTAAASASFHGVQGHLSVTSTRQVSLSHLLGDHPVTQVATRDNTAKTKITSRKELNVSKQAPSAKNALAPRISAPSVHLGPAIGSKVGLTNINGLSELDNDALLGGEVSPPDQGLCVAPLGGQTVVLEMTNMVLGFYGTDGTFYGGVSLPDFFADGYGWGDPRCVYDAQSNAIYLTELSLPCEFGGPNVCGGDLVALNVTSGNGYEYTVDWTDAANSGCPCLGDQMRVGFDARGIYLTADEFPLYGPGNYGYGYNGSAMYILSKADVLGGLTTPYWYYNNLALGGIPILGLMPAQSQTFAGSEWLANTFPYDIAGNNNSVSNQVALWRVTGDGDIENTAPTVTATLTNTEQYAYPVTGVSTAGTFTSVNVNDDRIGQIEFSGNHLYTTVETAVNVTNDPNTYDGVAWFDFNTVTKAVSHQGYVAYRGDYLTYPSIIRTHAGKSYINYTVSNGGLNPSAAFSNRTSDTSPFGSPQIAAYGVTPQFDFTYRWGDYSASAIDPNGTTVWMANEYIPPLADQGYFANWGTRVYERTN